MGFLDKWHQYREMHNYKRFQKRFNRLPPEYQRQVAGSIYEEIWEGIREQPTVADGTLGGTSIVFNCPYPGHISFHATRKINSELKAEGTPIHSYTIDGDAKEGWILTVIARGETDESARLIADAFAMSIILGIPTASGSYERVQFAVAPQGSESIEEAAKHLCEIIPGVLRGKYSLQQSSSDPSKVDIVEFRD